LHTVQCCLSEIHLLPRKYFFRFRKVTVHFRY
jgi:hypothetical protein